MALTSSQATTLRNAVTSDASVASQVQNHDAYSIAAVYNQATSTQIWRPDLSPSMLYPSIVASEAITQSAQALLLAEIVLSAPVIDASNPNVRAQFATVFPASTCVSTIANMTAVAQRPASKFETLYISNQVSAVYGYVLTPLDVQQAMGW